MRFLTLTILSLVALSSTVMAKQITAEVNGLVCDFCAQSVKKVIGKQDGVTNVDVNLETKMIAIDLNDDATLSDETITQLIKDSGYDLVAIHRD